MSVGTIISRTGDGLPTIHTSFIHEGIIFVSGSCVEIAQLTGTGLASNLYELADRDSFNFTGMFKPGTPSVIKHAVKVTCNRKVVLDLHYNDTGELRDEQGLPLPPDTKRFIDSLMYLCSAEANLII